MATTFVKISTVTIGSGGASSIDFNSIPQTYTDLQIVISARGATGGGNISLRFNGSTSSYSSRRLYGDGSAAYSDSASGTSAGSGSAILAGVFSDSGTTANVFGSQQIYIPNYTSANYKSVSVEAVSENNATAAYQEINAGLWSNTAAITSISLITYQSGGTFAQYSTATLYGIKSS